MVSKSILGANFTEIMEKKNKHAKYVEFKSEKSLLMIEMIFNQFYLMKNVLGNNIFIFNNKKLI